MKKKIIISLLAILTGAILAFGTLFYLNKETNNAETIYALQIGAYASLENAQKIQAKYPEAIIYPSEKYYHVLIGASKSKEGLQKIANVLQKENILYYEKEFVVSNPKKIDEYNTLLLKAENDKTIMFLNTKILEEMGEV